MSRQKKDSASLGDALSEQKQQNATTGYTFSIALPPKGVNTLIHNKIGGE